MSILRRIGKWFGILIFSLFLHLAILNLFLINFTGPDNLKPFFTDLFKEFITYNATQDQLTDFHEDLLNECKQKDAVEFPILNTSATMSCEEIRKSSPEQLPNLVGGVVFDNIYYKKYDCSFIQCLKQPGEEKLLVIFSLKANQFLKTIQSVLWISTGVGLVLILVSPEGWANKLKTLGSTLLFMGITVIILIFVKDYLPIQVPEFALDIIGSLLSRFFNFIFKIFLTLTIIGAVLTVSGHVLNLSSKKVKNK